MPAAPGPQAALPPAAAPAPAPAPVAPAPEAPAPAPAAPAAAEAGTSTGLPPLTHKAELPIDRSTGQRYTDWNKAVDDLRRDARTLENNISPHAQRMGRNLAQQADDIEKSWGLQKLGPGEYYNPADNKVYDMYAAAASTGFSGKALDNAVWTKILTNKDPVAARSIIADQRRMFVNNAIGDLFQSASVPGWKLPMIQQEFATGAAGRRLLAARTASLAQAESEARQLLPTLLPAIERLDRTRFPNVNSLIRVAETKTGSPQEIQAAIAMESFISVYARVLKPTGGVINRGDVERAHHLLNRDWSKGQFAAAFSQFENELNAAKRGNQDAIGEYNKAGHWNIPDNASPTDALRILAGLDDGTGKEPGRGGGAAGGAAPGGGAAAPAAPGAAPAGGVIRWERGPDGVPRRVQ